MFHAKQSILPLFNDGFYIMVFLPAMLLLHPEWYELCCQQESSLSLAHCFHIVIGLYSLSRAFHWDCGSVVNRHGKALRGGESLKTEVIKNTLRIVTVMVINAIHRIEKPTNFFIVNFSLLPSLIKIPKIRQRMNHWLLFNMTQTDTFTNIIVPSARQPLCSVSAQG